MTDTQKTFLALTPLYVGTARAWNKGDILTAEQVEAGGWKDQVQAHGQVEVAEPGSRPSNSATKGEWVAYATHTDRGTDQLSIEHADSLKRDELIELFG